MIVIIVGIHIKIAFIEVIADYGIGRQRYRNARMFGMEVVYQRFHQVYKRFSGNLMDMVGLRFGNNEVGNNTNLFLCISRNPFHAANRCFYKCGVAIILFRIHFQPHNQFQPRFLYHFQLRFRKFTPIADGIVSPFLYHFQVKLQ